MDSASQRIATGIGWNQSRDAIQQLAEEIVASQEGESFLKAARRGRPSIETLRSQVVQEVERLIQVKKRKPRISRKVVDVGDPLPGIG